MRCTVYHVSRTAVLPSRPPRGLLALLHLRREDLLPRGQRRRREGVERGPLRLADLQPRLRVELLREGVRVQDAEGARVERHFRAALQVRGPEDRACAQNPNRAAKAALPRCDELRSWDCL